MGRGRKDEVSERKWGGEWSYVWSRLWIGEEGGEMDAPTHGRGSTEYENTNESEEMLCTYMCGSQIMHHPHVK